MFQILTFKNVDRDIGFFLNNNLIKLLENIKNKQKRNLEFTKYYLKIITNFLIG